MSSGYLTTHILDTMSGRPAAGVRIELFRIGSGGKTTLATATSNADGRTDSPLLTGADMRPGIYELQFDMGQYFEALGAQNDFPFTGRVKLRFGIADANEHYHVPLLASPYSYSTYRGS